MTARPLYPAGGPAGLLWPEDAIRVYARRCALRYLVDSRARRGAAEEARETFRRAADWAAQDTARAALDGKTLDVAVAAAAWAELDNRHEREFRKFVAELRIRYALTGSAAGGA